MDEDEKDFVTIAHISDLHFTKDNIDASCYSKLINDLKKGTGLERPDIIVITGDIFEKEEIKDDSYQKIVDMLKNFSIAAQRNDKHPTVPVFIVPGNHDLRVKGVYNKDDTFLKLLSKLPFKILRAYVKSKYAKKYTKRFAKEEEAIKAFNKVFKQDKNIFKIETEKLPKHDILIGCFNSNRTNNDYEFAKGVVLSSDFDNFDNYLGKIYDKKERLKYKKIALLHHHPMPIYLSETSENVIESYQSSFLILSNSATFMRRMLKNSITLILHGHKHFSGFSKASFPVDPSFKTRRTVAVISAASVNPEEATLSYNIIRYYNSGKVTLEIREATGEDGFSPKSGEPIEIFTHAEARQNTFIECMDVFDTISDNTSIFYTIEQPSGDMIVKIKHEEIVTHKEERCKVITQEITSTNDLLAEQYEIINNENRVVCEYFYDELKDKKPTCKIKYSYTLAKGYKPLTYEHLYTLPNAFSFSREEKKWDIITKETKKNKNYRRDKELKESILVDISKNQGYKNLYLHVKFPQGFEPTIFDVMVKDKNKNKINRDEQEYCKLRLSHFKESNTVTLFVDNALIDHEYAVEWKLPKAKSENKSSKSRKIVKKLLDLRDNSKKLKQHGYRIETELLKKLRDDILEYINNINSEEYTKHDKQDIFDLSIFVFNEDFSKYQYVIRYCIHGMSRYYPIKNQIDIAHGHHVVGVAAKHKVPAWIIPVDNKKIENRHISKHIVNKMCRESLDTNFYAMIAIPLFFPINSKNLIGIVELASCSKNTVLSYIKDSSNDDKTATNMSLLQDLLHGDFLKGLCKTITGCPKLTCDSCTEYIKSTLTT
ncbi:Metallophosphoesterase domain protein [Candidatus Magnetobacterium bavaricum]|uniref:Metallophosphoesterase domain protein n=1 Tax=Candidatus Magnetobacterium bavaricum TaxID=29290 RepID=A0A0F3GWN9_9BACT|nr:Metallophosphoesterase domain protein [Candidatus Magnetobacterium bavaricum]